jgi:hypothetical protein
MMTQRMQQQNKAVQQQLPRPMSASASRHEDSSDDEYVPVQRHNSSVKRKRHAAEMDSHSSSSSLSAASASAAAASPSSSTSHSFPCLSDYELRVPSSFIPVGKFLFALEDETRDRGSAKLAIIHVQLTHPAFAAAGGAASASSSSRHSSVSRTRNYTASFKIDGRKSFSNAPFKKYYTRGVHAAWFASPTKETSATNPALNASFPCVTDGRVLFVLSQRNGKPQGKAFAGMLHDKSSYSSKHPLLCLSSNSVEYYLHVYLSNHAQVDGEPAVAVSSWSDVEVDVSARFDAGSVRLDSLALGAASHIVQPQSKLARTSVPHASSMLQMSRCASIDSSSSSASSYVSSTASPVPSVSSTDDSDVSDSPRLESPLPAPSSDEDGANTPLHEQESSQDGESSAEAELAGELHFELPYTEFESESDSEQPPAPPVVQMEEEPKHADPILRLPNGVVMQPLDLVPCEIYAAAVAAPSALEMPPMFRGASQPFSFSLRMPESSPISNWAPRTALGMPAPAAWAALLVEQTADMPISMPASHMLAMSPLPTNAQLPSF